VRDADLDVAARGIVWDAFMNAGQTCSSVERVYVERPVPSRSSRRCSSDAARAAQDAQARRPTSAR
jgi:acyl-CoA reductase-like NAD-dependent aldehyde dehydrogenase